MSCKPRIGIATGCGSAGGEKYLSQLSMTYVRSVVAGGGIPLLLPPNQDSDVLSGALDAVDGLVLPGGPDLDPAYYGESPHPMWEPVTGPREGFDIRLCRLAFEKEIPILGICHGCQVVNVALGGSLVQDILTAFPESPVVHRRRVFPFFVPHTVSVEPGSLLESIVGGPRIETNSAHHQSVKRAAEGLRVVARADDGVVEAVEWVGDRRFLLGIQWHPEEMAQSSDGPHRALFRALTQAALARSFQPG